MVHKRQRMLSDVADFPTKVLLCLMQIIRFALVYHCRQFILDGMVCHRLVVIVIN